MRSSVLALALSLSACASAGGVAITHNEVPRAGVPSHADYAASLGPTPVVMQNSPFAPASVVHALQRNNVRQNLVFSTDPPATPARDYRLLLSFDEMPVGGMQVCRNTLVADAPPPTKLAASGTTSVYGAFCLGPTLLSEAVATAPRFNGPNDPRLGRAMGDLLAALMPIRDPHQNSRSLQVRPE